MIKIKTPKISTRNSSILSNVSQDDVPRAFLQGISEIDGEVFFHYGINFNINVEKLVITEMGSVGESSLEISFNQRRDTSPNSRLFSPEVIKKHNRLNGKAFLDIISKSDTRRKKAIVQYTNNKKDTVIKVSMMEHISSDAATYLRDVISTEGLFNNSRSEYLQGGPGDDNVGGVRFGFKREWEIVNVSDLHDKNLNIRLPQLRHSTSPAMNAREAPNLSKNNKDKKRPKVRDNCDRPKLQHVDGVWRSGNDLFKNIERQHKSPIYNSDNYKPSARSFSDNYYDIIRHGKDPGVIMQPGGTVTQGSCAKISDYSGHNKSYALDLLRVNQEAKIVGFEKNIQTTDQLPRGSKVALQKKVSARIRMVSFDICIPKKMARGKKNLDIGVSLKNKSGKKIGDINLKIDHENSLNMINLPKTVPKLKICERSFSTNPKHPTLILSVIDNPGESYNDNMTAAKRGDVKYGYKIYKRSIHDTLPPSAVRWTNVSTIKGEIGPSVQVKIVPNGSSLELFRLVQYTGDGQLLCNFSNEERELKPWQPTYAVFSTRSTKKGISVTLISLPPGVESAIIRRKNITVTPDKRFSKIQSGNEMQLVPGITSVDTSAREGNLYEYRLDLYRKGGVTVGSNFRTQAHVIPMKFVKINLSRMSIKDSSKSGSSVYATPVVISFLIDFSFTSNKNSLNMIVGELKRRGVKDQYTDDIKKNRSSLDNLVFFCVDRLDLTVGKTEHVGVYPAGVVMDTGSVSSGKPSRLPKSSATQAVRGRDYRYRVTAMLVSPDQSLDDIRKQAQNDIKTSNDMKDPQKIYSLKEGKKRKEEEGKSHSDDRNINTYDNVLNAKSLTTGVIPSGFTDQSNVLTRNSTGDIAEITATMSNMTHSVLPAGKNGIIEHTDGTVIVKWMCKYPPTFVDFYVVSCTKQGQDTIVGNAHGQAYENGTFTYLDRQSINYVGEITYKVTPIMIDGSRQPTVNVGKIIKRPPANDECCGSPSSRQIVVQSQPGTVPGQAPNNYPNVMKRLK